MFSAFDDGLLDDIGDGDDNIWPCRIVGKPNTDA